MPVPERLPCDVDADGGIALVVEDGELERPTTHASCIVLFLEREVERFLVPVPELGQLAAVRRDLCHLDRLTGGRRCAGAAGSAALVALTTGAEDTAADGLAPVDGPQAATAKATATPAINALVDLRSQDSRTATACPSVHQIAPPRFRIVGTYAQMALTCSEGRRMPTSCQEASTGLPDSGDRPSGLAVVALDSGFVSSISFSYSDVQSDMWKPMNAPGHRRRQRNARTFERHSRP